MRTMLVSVGLALTSVGLVLAACGASSDNDTPATGHGGSNPGGAAGTSGAAATAGRFTSEAGAGGTAEGGTGGAAEAGEGGASEAGASGSAQAGEGGEGGATGSDNAGSGGNGGGGGSAGSSGSAGSAGSGGSGGSGGSVAGGANCPAQLLVGGSDITAQGWSTRMQTPAAITYGADYVRLETSTNSGASTSGQLLLYYPAAFVANQAFKVKVEMLVETASPHNQLDSGAAILGSFTSPFGNTTDRSEMVYLDSAALGWSDDTQSAAFPVTDGSYHTYVLSVDAAGLATLSVDGTVRLTRTGYASNGTLAIGDQTNDAKVDGALRIRAVTRECP